jgi:predicted lysophospholipase L1 biosynthesis ABC-type transport system permease subunit
MSGRITCETAAQCEKLARIQESLLLDAVVWTVIGVIAITIAFQIYQMRRESPPDT